MDESLAPFESAAFEQPVVLCILGNSGQVVLTNGRQRFPRFHSIHPSNLDFNHAESIAMSNDA